MGGDALLGDVIHPLRADLDLNPYSPVAHQGAVKRLIAIAFRMLHPIAYTIRLVAVYSCYYREYVVALVALAFLGVCRRCEDNPQSIKVIDLIKGDVLGLHLVPDRIWSLDPLADLEIESGFFQGLVYRSYEIVYLLASTAKIAVDQPADLLVSVRFLVLQPDVLHLGLYLVKAEAMGEGNEYEHRLAENLIPLVFRHILNRAAIVEAVGELYQHDPHVIVQRQQDPLEVLRLKALGVGIIEFLAAVLVVEHVLDLGQAVHKTCDLVTEELAYVIHRIVSVFHDIVEQGGRDGLVPKPDVAHDNFCYLDRMDYVWPARATADILMGFIREIERFLDHVQLLLVRAAFLRRGLKLCVTLTNQFVVLFCEL